MFFKFYLMDKKEQILETATDLFASNGFDGTSIRDISHSAGVNIAMVNYYFGSKDKLFTQIIENKLSHTHERLVEIAADTTMNEMEKMEAVVDVYVYRILAFPSLHRILQQELIFALRSGIQEMITKVFRSNMDIITGIIEKGIEKGLFKRVDGPLTLASIVGTANQVMSSKKICLSFINTNEDIDPYQDKEFRDRVLNHLKQMMRSHLLK